MYQRIQVYHQEGYSKVIKVVKLVLATSYSIYIAKYLISEEDLDDEMSTLEDGLVGEMVANMNEEQVLHESVNII